MMTADYILYLGRHTMETALLVSAPILLVCAVLGILISLFQTVTSIRDMTLSTAPKVIGVALTTLLFGHWMLQILMKFTYEIFTQIQTYGQ
jgi:flagellar biosynthetic protein FliQ